MSVTVLGQRVQCSTVTDVTARALACRVGRSVFLRETVASSHNAFVG
jgi:hypothetical protein